VFVFCHKKVQETLLEEIKFVKKFGKTENGRTYPGLVVLNKAAKQTKTQKLVISSASCGWSI
jgi:hypothetical protein